jgi:hypothetical protein
MSDDLSERVDRGERLAKRLEARRDWIALAGVVEWFSEGCDGEFRSPSPDRQKQSDVLAKLRRAIETGEFDEQAKTMIAFADAGQAAARGRLRLPKYVLEFSPLKDSAILSMFAPRRLCVAWFERHQYRKPNWLSDHAQPRPKAKRGRKPGYDWPTTRELFMKEMNRRGDFDEPGQVDDWCTQAQAERFVASLLNNEPSESTIREHVAKWSAEWRKAGKGR